MAPQTKITIEEVSEAVLQLRENGEKVTFRNVHAITGGSMSTVFRLLNDYLDQEAQEEQFKIIGKDLVKALMVEIKTVTNKETESIRSTIKQAYASRHDAFLALGEYEKKDVAHRVLWQQEVAALKDQVQDLGTSLARTEGERDSMIRELDDLKSENKELTDQLSRQAQEIAFHKGRAGYEESQIGSLASKIETEIQPPA